MCVHLVQGVIFMAGKGGRLWDRGRIRGFSSNHKT